MATGGALSRQSAFVSPSAAQRTEWLTEWQPAQISVDRDGRTPTNPARQARSSKRWSGHPRGFGTKRLVADVCACATFQESLSRAIRGGIQGRLRPRASVFWQLPSYCAWRAPPTQFSPQIVRTWVQNSPLCRKAFRANRVANQGNSRFTAPLDGSSNP